MSRQQTLRRSVAALAIVSLIVGTQLAVAGPAVASGYRHHGSSYTYSYGGYRPYYGSAYRYRHGHQGHRYSHHRPYHRGHSSVGIGVHGHGSRGAAVVGALGAGVLLGYLLTRPQSRPVERTYSRSTQAPVVRTVPARPSSPTFGYGKQVQRDCKPTTGGGLHQGRRATFGGTFCYDANGQGYIVPGSEFLIGYAN
ncbi:MAG: hypothetical protein GKS02_05635 [Alphaproteobacteria bacterium]|nr:hypothetical protein [Alphaproteobacteria bacterium]